MRGNSRFPVIFHKAVHTEHLCSCLAGEALNPKEPTINNLAPLVCWQTLAAITVRHSATNETKRAINVCIVDSRIISLLGLCLYQEEEKVLFAAPNSAGCGVGWARLEVE